MANQPTYDEFLDWKRTKYDSVHGANPVADKAQAAPRNGDVAIEMEPMQEDLHPARKLVSEPISMSDPSKVRDKLDSNCKDCDPALMKSDGKTATFAWRDVSYKVPLKTKGVMGFCGRKTGDHKVILDKVSGFSRPGEVLFVMGPSGAGKSSMLDALADRVALPTQGLQWLNNEVKTEASLRAVSKYVQQDDRMMGALTVKETLETAAAFYVADASKRAPLIEATIKMVGLQDQTNTKVGDVFFRGLSGGQKRRLSIAIELLAQPEMLFLDEPTSGLDSAAAFSIMQSLRRMAKTTNTNMIVVIHQPSELLFELGDNLLLLSGGQQVYFGPIVGHHGVVEHFESLGFTCPPRTSVAEWLLDLVNRDFGSDRIVDQCLDGWVGSVAHQNLMHDLDELKVPPVNAAPAAHKDPLIQHYATSQFTQTMALLKRGFINSMRSPAVIWLRFAMYVMLAILIGTVWLRLGNSAKVITDINGCLFYTVAFMIFMSISVLPAYLEERAQFVRERANGAYSVASYLISHLLFELPGIFLLALVCSSIIYWLVGLTASASRFFIFVANLFMSLMVAESIMVLISAMVPYLIVGIALGAFVFGAFMCVMGYFVAFSQIGWWWKWMRYIAVHYYSFSTFMVNQYRDQTYEAFCIAPGSFPCYTTDVTGEAIYGYLGLITDLYKNFLAMVAMIFIFRILAGVYMQMKVNGKK